MRGVLGVALAIMFCVAREGIRLHGQLTERDRLAFYKICGAQVRIWTLADTRQSFRDFVDRAGSLFRSRPLDSPQLDGSPIGSVDWYALEARIV